MKKIAILNTDPLTCNYGGVAPFIRNLDPFLQKEFSIKYFYVQENAHKDIIPRRFKILWKLLMKKKELSQFDFIISHIPEGSYIASFNHVPYAHIYHGNDNPMSISRFWYGKYFAKIYDKFYNRIAKTATLKYTVGPTWGNVKKIFNPISHDIEPIPGKQRRGFIFAGRLEKGKHIDRLIKIYSHIPTEIQNEHHFYIAGRGTQEDSLKELVQKMNLNDKIHFIGSLTNKELIKEEKMETVTDALVNRRIDISGFTPNLKSAMLTIKDSGTAVLTTDDGQKQYVHELTSAEQSRLSQVLGSDVDDATKRQRIGAMVSAITFSQQASQNYEQIVTQQQSQEQNLQRK